MVGQLPWGRGGGEINRGTFGGQPKYHLPAHSPRIHWEGQQVHWCIPTPLTLSSAALAFLPGTSNETLRVSRELLLVSGTGRERSFFSCCWFWMLYYEYAIWGSRSMSMTPTSVIKLLQKGWFTALFSLVNPALERPLLLRLSLWPSFLLSVLQNGCSWC